MAAFDHPRSTGAFPEDMNTANHIIRATLRQTAPASCFMQGTDGLVRKDWPLSGSTTE
jgi:hypothetical protein